MSVKPTSKQLEGLVDILLEDHEDGPSAAAKAAWQYMAGIYAARARFAVIIQVKGTEPEGAGETVEDTVVLGPYSTAGDAESAAKAARYPAGETIECRAMVVEWHDTSPSSWLKDLKARKKAREPHEMTQAERLLEYLDLEGYLPEGDER